MSDNTFRILILEDNPGDAYLLRKALTRTRITFQPEDAGRLADALRRLAENTFGLVFVDLGLPDAQGLEGVIRIREQNPDVAVVVLTSTASDNIAMEALDCGAQDYLVKGAITTEMLERTIRYAVQRQNHTTQIRKLLTTLQHNELLLKRKNRRLTKLYRTAHRFVDNVSHEFRTPLTVIKEYVSLLSEGYVGETTAEQRRMLNTVGDRADDLNNMVDDMLDVSRLESGLLGMARQTCQIRDILEHVRPALENKALIRNVSLEVDVPDGLPMVYCDPEKIARVVINLAVNAIKFSNSPGSVCLWAKEDGPSGDVLIGATDNGPGIREEDLEVIFQRFKQLPRNTNKSTKGFGLGLNIAKELVELNFGELRVASSLGCGSTFSFTVPAARPLEVLGRYLKHLHRKRGPIEWMSLWSAEIEDHLDSKPAAETEALLNYVFGPHDFLLRSDAHRWLAVLSVGDLEETDFAARVHEGRSKANRNRIHGPLPSIVVKKEGAWRVNGNTGSILECARRVLECEEIACAQQ